MKLSERIFSVFILFVLFSTAMPGQQAPLGMNLGGVVDWSSQLPFVDVFRSARNWIPQQVDGGPWDTGEQLNVDSLGWIAALDSGQAAGTLMTRDLNGHYPAGTYVCLYDGEGQIRFGFDARTTSESPGRIELEVTPGNGGIYLKIVATNPADPVRNIRVLMPGFETTYQSEPFYPPFLDMIGQYRVLRFMDWMRTNNNETETWSQRTSPQHRSFAGGTGVPVEVMVELANRLQIDPWFCMPHRADDHFVREFARYVRDNLDPGLTPYLEYSNEVWNGIFSQAGYARQRGLELNLSSNEYQAQLYFYSMRSVQLFQIWQGEFGSRDFVRVLASQSANPWTGEQVMDFQDAYQNADVLATAPYFGGFLGSPSLESRVQQMSVDEVLDSCMADINRVKVRMQTNYQNAQSRGLGLVAYEAGQHLAGHGGVENNQTITDLFIAANYHPRMEDLYQAYLNAWNEAGGGLMAIFSSCGQYSKWGSWGIVEFQDQPWDNYPKYRAVQAYLNNLTGFSGGEHPVPQGFTLGQNYPNPFNPSTRIPYFLSEAGTVSLTIFDLAGRKVRQLVARGQSGGMHVAEWDGLKDNGEAVGSGVFFYRLTVDGYSATRKLTLLR